ncbi:MAG: PCYCGC motif-containing (lipo)protein [Terriglobia bacterium]
MVMPALGKRARPQAKARVLPAILAAALCWGLIYATPGSASPAQSASAKAKVPPYHAHPPRGALPQVLPWSEFAGNPLAENAYCFAAKMRPVLYQQPCYCPCSRDLGHTCLLDCFTRPDRHAAVCATCLQEAIFAYRQTMTGADAKTIRAEIIKGEWKKVDLRKYTQPPPR